MFAGFTVSPWSVPPEVYADAGKRVNWEDDRMADVLHLLEEISQRCEQFIQKNDGLMNKQKAVENCENMKRKLDYAIRTHKDDENAWVVNVDEVNKREGRGTTKNIEVKPVRVGGFLDKFVWSRGQRRLITSATIPYRANIEKWARRLGLDGETRFVSKSSPFPVEHRKIHTNTEVGEMSGDGEERNWSRLISTIEDIMDKHDGEKGLIHSVSYPRAEELASDIGADYKLLVDDGEGPVEAAINEWQSDAQVMITPRMSEGVDLNDSLCRFQILPKCPFAFAGDSRVSYLLNEEHDWDWYYQSTLIEMMQMVGRAVRGPEQSEAASFYVLDSKFHDVINRTNPPQYFVDSITSSKPAHWFRQSAAPWRAEQ